MRSALGYTGAVTGAVALARGDLGPAAANPNIPAGGFWSTDEAGAPPNPTNPDEAQWLNAIMEEFQYALDLGSVAHAPGANPMDATNNAQLADILSGCPAIDSDAADTGLVSTARARFLASVFLGQATGDASAVIASLGTALGVRATGTASAAVGCGENTIASGIDAVAVAATATTVSGDQAAAVAADTVTVSQDGSAAVAAKSATVSGLHAAALAADGDPASALTVSGAGAAVLGSTATNTKSLVASGANAVAVASKATGANSTVADAQSAVVASTDCSIAVPGAGAVANQAVIASLASTCTAAKSAIIASDGSAVSSGSGRSACLATDACSVTGQMSAAVASDTATVSSDASAAIACTGAPGPTVALLRSVCLASDGAVAPAAGASNQVYGGTGGVCTWRIDGLTGTLYAGVAGGAVAFNQQNHVAPNYAAIVTGGADYAEAFPLYTPGHPLPLRRLIAHVEGSAKLAVRGDRILGVTSTHPATIGGGSEAGIDYEAQAVVGLVGQVEVEVLTPCRSGDFLEPSAWGFGAVTATPDLLGARVSVLRVLRQPEGDNPGVALCLVR